MTKALAKKNNVNEREKNESNKVKFTKLIIPSLIINDQRYITLSLGMFAHCHLGRSNATTSPLRELVRQPHTPPQPPHAPHTPHTPHRSAHNTWKWIVEWYKIYKANIKVWLAVINLFHVIALWWAQNPSSDNGIHLRRYIACICYLWPTSNKSNLVLWMWTSGHWELVKESGHSSFHINPAHD